MFGNNTNQQQTETQDNGQTAEAGGSGKVVSPLNANGDTAGQDPSPSSPAQPAATDDQSASVLPGSMGGSEPAQDTSAAPAPATTAPVASPSPSDSTSQGSDHLLSLKQDALNELSPLVAHLDQSPEEKFRTVMMMIQATDDQTKIQEAYDAAKKISDDKVRAQALLDVVNEINYFTQSTQKKDE